MLTEIFSDPVSYITSFLLALPGLLLALCGHEAAHGLVALWCGDPTAKYAGRITLNPLRHLDPVGFLCMAVFHFGWAKPVPVNPNNYRHPRRDDFFVSIAGITANLIMCVLGFIGMSAATTALLRDLGAKGFDVVEWYQYSYALKDNFTRQYGTVAGYLYDMLRNFSIINLSLATFNLLPIPPLDGYHVLNDLILRNRNLFVRQRVAQIGSAVLLLILVVPQLSNLYGNVLSGIFTHVYRALGWAAFHLIRLAGLI